MPGGGSKPGERRGGRPKGALNKATLERIERATAMVHGAKSGKKLGVDILNDFAQLFTEMAETHQPLPPGTVDPSRDPDEEKFRFYAPLAVQTARWLAEFQSPKLKAVAVMMAPPRDDRPTKALGDNVTSIDDPLALSRVYKLRLAGVK